MQGALTNTVFALVVRSQATSTTPLASYMIVLLPWNSCSSVITGSLSIAE
jgi:hypothetical protein